MRPAVLAVDGGNSKTDLALLGADGGLLAAVRGGTSSPHHVGVDGCVGVLSDLLDEARGVAGLEAGEPVAEVAQVMLAGADLPVEEAALRDALAPRGWAARTVVANDTYALLRTGSERGWGVAIVCGAGVNCLGVGPDGALVRFPALGGTSGDWGGGSDVGYAGQFAAARAEDGRGPATSLATAIPAAFGVGTPREVAEAIHFGRIPRARLVDVAPVVLAEARAGDAEARAIVDRLVAELVGFGRVALERLDLLGGDVDIVLGGGLVRSDDGQITEPVRDGLLAMAPRARVTVTTSAPIVGAALLGFDELGANSDVHARVRASLDRGDG